MASKKNTKASPEAVRQAPAAPPPIPTERATHDEFDALHGLVVAAVRAEIAAYIAAGERVPPALLAQGVKLLDASGLLTPAPSKKPKADPLAGDLPDFSSDLGSGAYRGDRD